jgi:predicted DNA-binding transcriptional regulator AlpA
LKVFLKKSIHRHSYIHRDTDGFKQGRLASVEILLTLHLMENGMQKYTENVQLSNNCEILLRKNEVLRIIGLSNSTFYKRIKDGIIPGGVPMGPRLKGWPASDISAYVEKCIAQRNGEKA